MPTDEGGPTGEGGQQASPLEPTLVAWVEEVLGGTLTRCVRTPGGGSRYSYFVTVSRAHDGQVAAVLRVEAGGSFTGTEINVAKEAAVYQALAPTSVPVPAVLGVAPGGAAVLLEMLSGRSDIGETSEERDATMRAFMKVVADLHQIDVDGLDLPGFERPTTPADHAALDLGMWVRLGAVVPDLDPLLGYTGAFLVAHPPLSVARSCLVQGDTGPGNFLAVKGEVTGLCDMEFAHIGDPMDDIAWIMLRARRVVPDMTPYLDQYTRQSGVPILPASVDFYRLAVQYRCAITTSLAVARGGGARGWPPYLLVTERFILGVANQLSSYLGVPDPPLQLPDFADTSRTPWYDALVQAVRAGARGIADDQLREEMRNHQILVHYLRAYDRMGPQIEALDAEDGRQSAGIDTAKAGELGCVAQEAGAQGDEVVLSFLLRRTRRRASLWQTLIDRSG